VWNTKKANHINGKFCFTDPEAKSIKPIFLPRFGQIIKEKTQSMLENNLS
jgi:hypothetical protein